MSYKLAEDDKRIPLDNERVTIVGTFAELGEIDNITLVGAGGTSLVYCARMGTDTKRYCILKEYWPKERSKYDAEYMRDFDTGEIVLVGDEKRKVRERSLQDVRKNYEKSVTEKLYSDPEKLGSNSNHVFYMSGCFDIGDTYYYVIETTKGQTLYEKVLNAPKRKLDIASALKRAKIMIELVRFMFYDRGYCHGDLKPENIWCGNDSDNNDVGENLYIMDFGSAFSWKKYKERKYANEQDYLDFAEEIVSNPGIGWSSENYKSVLVANLYGAKMEYKLQLLESARLQSAKNLLEQMKKIDVSVDLYAVVKIFYFMIVGSDYDMDNPMGDELLSEIVGCEIGVAKEINRIMLKNANERYCDVDELYRELQCLEALYNKEASPFVWMQNVINDAEFDLHDFDINLLCDVKLN